MFFKKKEKHHPFSPSALQRRKRCPASYSVEKDLEDVENEYSRKGTYMHDLIAQAINKGKHFKVKTKEEREIIVKVINYINLTLGAARFIHTEERLEYKSKKGNVLYYGTSDLVAMSVDGQLTVFDWKTGKGVVPSAKDNLQLKAYALAAMQMYNVETCKVCIYNPVNGQNSTHIFTDKNDLVREIIEVINACLVDNPPFVPGSQCRFCLGAIHRICPEGELQEELGWKNHNVQVTYYADGKPLIPKKSKLPPGVGFLLVLVVILMIIGAIFGQ